MKEIYCKLANTNLTLKTVGSFRQRLFESVMRFKSILVQPPRRETIEQKLMSLIQDSTKFCHLLQIHAFLVKSSLDQNNFLLAKLLNRIVTSSALYGFSYARSLFNSVSSPDPFLWNTMLRAYLHSSNTQDALSVFLQMHIHGAIILDSFSLSIVLQACGRSAEYQNGLTIHALALKLGFNTDLFVQTALIEMYAKFGYLDTAQKILYGMKNPDLVAYNVLLAEYVRAGEITSAHRLFNKMTERDLVSWNTMIHGYASVGDVGTAKKLFDQSSERDIVSWSSMISAYTKIRQSSEALRLFHEMQLAKVVPDKVTMVSVLSACGDVGALGMGKTVHEYIDRNKIEIDLKLGTSLVDMYAKCGDIDSSMTVFNRMAKRDVLAWSAMIIGLANHGLGDVALGHFSQMVSDEIKPNDITFIAVLSACSHFGLIDRGRAYFASMRNTFGITPKIEHFGCMVDILGRAGLLEEARELIGSMPFKPDAIIWRTFLAACKIYKNVELAEEAAVNLLELEPHEDGNYVLLSNIYSQSKKWDKVATVRRMMRNVCTEKVPGSSSLEVDNEVHEFVSCDRSHPKSEEIYQMLAEIVDRLKLDGYKPLIESVLQDFDERQKENALAYHSEKLAIAFGILSSIPGSTIRIVKNLRVCDDCHLAMKFISRIYNRKIIVRDRNRFHHFLGGSCSCKDYW